MMEKEIIQLLNSMVENDRGNLIQIIKKNIEAEIPQISIWSIALEPKQQLRLRVRNLILKKLEIQPPKEMF